MQGHSLFKEAKMRVQEVGLRSILLQYVGINVPDKRRFNCILPSHEDKKQSASIFNNYYKCHSAHCESSQGVFGSIDLIACLKGERPSEVARVICRDYRSFSPVMANPTPVQNIKPCTHPMFGLSEEAHNALAYFWQLLNETDSIDHPVLNEWFSLRKLSIEDHYNYGVRVITKEVINQINPNDNAVIEAGLHSKWIGQEGTILIPVQSDLSYPIGYRLRRLRSRQPKEMDMTGRRVDLGTPLPPLGIRCLSGWSKPHIIVITEGTPDYLTALECLLKMDQNMDKKISVLGLNKVSARLDDWILRRLSKARFIIDLTHVKDSINRFKESKPFNQISKYKQDGLYRHGFLESNDLNDHHKRGETMELLSSELNKLEV